MAGERRPPPLAVPAAAQVRAPASLKPVPLRPSGVGRPDFGAVQDRVAYVPAAVPRLRTERSRRGRKPRYMTQERRAAYSGLVEEAEQMCAAHYELSSQATAESARRCFEFFIDEYKEERPDMFWGPADLGLSWKASLHNEISLMIWATWMVRIGLAPSTVTTYMSLVRTTIEAELGWRLTLSEFQLRLPKLLRRLRKMYATVRKKRLGWRAEHHRKWRRLVGYPTTEPLLLADAVMCVAREGLARIAELAPAHADEFDEQKHPTIGDLSLQEPRREGDLRHMVLWMLPAKKAPGKAHKMPVPLPEASGGEVGAFSALARMLRARQVAAGWHGALFDADGAVAGLPADAPLFARSASGASLTKAEMVDFFAKAAALLGLEGKVSGHSGRIGGATDHFAEETPPAVLQICGRWDSDLWQVYTRQCIDQTLKYTVRASKCADTAVEEIFDDYTQPAVVAAGV